MTDEEMAKERAAKFEEINYNESDNHGTEKEIGYHAYYCGFLAGLKAGRTQWHDLRKDPNDLPKVKKGKTVEGEPYHISNVVQNQKGQHCWYNYKYNKWCDMDYLLEEVIAWCEIPKYTEE